MELAARSPGFGVEVPLAGRDGSNVSNVTDGQGVALPAQPYWIWIVSMMVFMAAFTTSVSGSRTMT